MGEEKTQVRVQERVVGDYILSLEAQLNEAKAILNAISEEPTVATLKKVGFKVETPKKKK